MKNVGSGIGATAVARAILSAAEHVYKKRKPGGNGGGKGKGQKGGTGRKSNLRVSRTRTRTKRRRGRSNTGLNDTSEFSITSIGNSFRQGRLKPTKQKFSYKVIKNWDQQGMIGQQLVIEGYPMFTRAHLIGDTDAAPTFPNVKWPDDIYEFNPFSRVVSNDVFTGSGVYSATTKLGWINTTHEMTLVNTSSTAIQVSVLYCCYKKDCDDKPVDIWANAIEDQTSFQTDYTQRNAFASDIVPGTTPGTAGYNEYGMYPTKFNKFNRLIKVVAQSHHVMQAGTQKRISTNFKAHKVLNRDVVNDNLNEYLAGYTIYPMIIAKGAPVVVSETGTEGTLKREISYGHVGLGFIQSDIHHFCAVNEGSGMESIRSALGQLVGTIVGKPLTGTTEREITTSDTVQAVVDVLAQP